jgi:hypothetical protein
MRARSIALFVSSALAGGCLANGPDPSSTRLNGPAADVSKTYADLAALYGGDRGIYRGCGPNGGVCHNGKEFPNLATVGAIVENINADCNQKRDTPAEMHDFCERRGDRIRIGDIVSEIGFVEPRSNTAEDPPRTWRVHAKDPMSSIQGMQAPEIEIDRPSDAGDLVLYALADTGVTASLDLEDATGRSLLLTLPAAPTSSVSADGEPNEDFGAELAIELSRSGVAGDPRAIQVGDPNRNGVYGATLGGKLIKPGHPEKSYLFTRLTDPEAGPVMPRANCCYWTKDALRAMFCWVAGLKEDGSNALDPIDWASCPNGPIENIEYPEPGPSCETSGLCPVRVKKDVPKDATFSNVYAILSESCGGNACHVDSAAAGLDFQSEDAAYRDLQENLRVVPRDPDSSKLYVRVSPDRCMAPDCTLMPRGRPPLDDARRKLIRDWIANGAAR